MDPKTILLEPALYHDYAEGKEILCATKLELHSGDHVMVFKNSIAASTSVPVPHASQQSDSIGIEGLVIAIEAGGPGASELAIRKI